MIIGTSQNYTPLHWRPLVVLCIQYSVPISSLLDDNIRRDLMVPELSGTGTVAILNSGSGWHYWMSSDSVTRSEENFQESVVIAIVQLLFG